MGGGESFEPVTPATLNRCLWYMVWRPGSSTMLKKFESFQKNALSGFALRMKNPTLMRFI